MITINDIMVQIITKMSSENVATMTILVEVPIQIIFGTLLQLNTNS